MQEAVTQKCVTAFSLLFFAPDTPYMDASKASVYVRYMKFWEVVGMLLHRCRCGAMIPQGIQLCEACEEGSSGQQSRHMEYNRYRRNKKTAAFYVSNEWRGLRAYALALYDGLDLYAYYVQKKIMTADMVHHIVEVEDDWSLRLTVSNLFPLSNQNHGIISALYRKDEATKKQTQAQLEAIILKHWEGHGGYEKVLGVRS